MSKIQVEVRFTDKLESIRVDGQEMEIPNAIKAKSVEEWFEPAAGRVNWDGLGAEIKAMDFSGEKDAVYSFQFNGPEDKKREFMNCVECFCLGEEAQQETQEETEQDYLQDASDFQQVGNAEMAFQKYMVAASDYGRPEAQLEVARCYQNGIGVEKNAENAVVWYKKAAEQGNAEAQCALGTCYDDGIGTEKNEDEAVKLYKSAAEQECPEAQYKLGRCYFFGVGVERDENKAVEWYFKAAEQGNAEAQYALGNCYECGYSVEEDKEKAIEWYRKAAEQGDDVAQIAMGRYYYNKKINFYDREAAHENAIKAEKWYLKAAEQGSASGQFCIGTRYLYGFNQLGDGRNGEKAIEWLRRAAEQGHELAQSELADCYYNGEGTKENKQEAVKWYEAFGKAQEAVASVSCVAALRDKSKTEDKAFVQGIERFMDAMEGEKYTALFLAEPVSNETQAAIRSGYENLYSTLSPFRKSTWSYTENQSTAVMESLCNGTSHTISDTSSTTTTDGTSQSSSVTDGTQKTKGVSGGINGGIGSSSGTSVTKVSPVAGGIAGILGLGGVAASVLIPGAGAVIGPLLGTAGRAVGGMASSRTAFNSIARNIGGSLGVNASWGTSHSTTEQTGTSHSTSNGTSHGISDSTSQQESHGTTDTRGTGRTQQVELCNKSVEELLERIENQLKRVKESEDYGCYIDRLVEIFNACWPMYAAMPAVLKDAIERSYQKVGWNLRNSESEKGVFPTFFDLLDILPGVIEESHYSKDTQSDYVGALCTRVKSLTNGIYGSVLCAEDALTDEALFDCNVVVDLSRVGSMETKSLLMGILVMKLQEYRMCSSGMNSRLRHVTVLEEAHNLLRKTSAEQSQEGANLQGKSVEMLANAIAEMRTYGEGFIIADQAPGLLDMSVIRNTNTKIILRLPDEEDRKLVGKSAALKEAQIDELSKLPLGVAAVYQNEWPEAVLCQVKHYPIPENAVYCKPAEQTPVNTEFVLSHLVAGQKLEPLGVSEMEQVKRWLKRRELVLGINGCRTVRQALEGAPIEKDALEDVLEKLFDSRRVVTFYARADADGRKPRMATLNWLEDQYELEQQTAEWLLNHLMTMYIDHCQKPENAKELRRSFLDHGGKLL